MRSGLLGGTIFAGILAAIIVDQKNLSDMRTAKEAVSAREQYDDEGLVITESWQEDKTHSSVSDCLKQGR